MDCMQQSTVMSVCSETNSCMLFLTQVSLSQLPVFIHCFYDVCLFTAHNDYLCHYPSPVAFCGAACTPVHPAVTTERPGFHVKITDKRLYSRVGGGVGERRGFKLKMYTEKYLAPTQSFQEALRCRLHSAVTVVAYILSTSVSMQGNRSEQLTSLLVIQVNRQELPQAPVGADTHVQACRHL